MDTIKELSYYLNEVAPEAIVRYGDYPRGQNEMRSTVIMSQLTSVSTVKQYYDRMPDLMLEKERREMEGESKLRELYNAAIAVPSLLGGTGEKEQ